MKIVSDVVTGQMPGMAKIMLGVVDVREVA